MVLLTPRNCVVCGITKGCIAFRYQDKGEWKRGYFHLRCFQAFKHDKQMEKEK